MSVARDDHFLRLICKINESGHHPCKRKIKFVTSGPVVCMAWSGRDAISVARNLIGPTNGREAAPGTIRGDFGMDIGYNMIHGSDAAETAEFELGLWFPEGVNVWTQDSQSWVYE